ncbi:MAG: hypothetical protein K5945_02470 [Bacteroidaceae bacterium]|nr:hypothetical protein [Bacteroidaceae bacterium]
MRRFLIAILSVCFSLVAPAASGPAGRLATLLEQMAKREEVTPDSFFTDVQLLRQEIAAQQDSTARAIYRAALAHLLSVNAWRAQARSRETESHPDSIQEWSQEEYRQHCRTLYAQALQNFELLFAARTRDWLPLVKQGRDEAVFGSSMLSVVWNAAKNDRSASWHQTDSLFHYAKLADFYNHHGLREASLRILLDSISNNDTLEIRQAYFERLRREYEDIPACALVYYQMAQTEMHSAAKDDSTAFRAEALLEEALRRYPNAPNREAIQITLMELREPGLTLPMAESYYPDDSIMLCPQVRNMTEGSWSIYRLPENFKPEDWEDVQQVKRQGRLVESKRHAFAPHPSVEIWTDSIPWKAPDKCGRYAIVLDGKPGMAVEDKEAIVEYFRVTRLSFFTMQLSDDQLRLVAVDSKSGEPQKDVTVDFYRDDVASHKTETTTLLYRRTTGKNGRVEIALPNERISVQLSRGDDNALPKSNIYPRNLHHANERDSVFHLRIFTDRSIYRPGQTIYVSALAYKQKDWDARTVEGRPYTLTFSDTNNQTLVTHELKSDAFGMLADSLQIPSTGLPGSYRIRLGSQNHWVQVEEYKRPTFYVNLSSNPSSAGGGADTLSFSGKALTYSGAPVANARVTGSFHFFRSRWCWPPTINDSDDSGHIDTLWTDSEGRFEVRVPVMGTMEQLRSGRQVRLNVDVLSPQGETQQGSASSSICSTPLRLVGDVPDEQEKEHLGPWLMQLVDAAEQPVEGNVECILQRKGDDTQHRFQLPAGKQTVPQELATLPSGIYTVKATAVVGGDTAVWEGEDEVTLFSMYDSHLVEEKALDLYCPRDSFDIGRPAEVRIGTSLPETWIHALLISDAGITTDTVVHVSDTAFVWKIPYRSEYNQGAMLFIANYSDGRPYRLSKRLYLCQPDMKLRPHWETFRDRLRPGEHEEWRLSLHRPDGSPAQANVLLSLYDKSLDAILPHSLRMNVYRPHRIPSIQTGGYYRGIIDITLPIYGRRWKVRHLELSLFDGKYFPMLDTVQREYAGGAMRVYKTASRSAPMAAQKFDYANVKELSFESVDEALNGQIAGLDIAAKEFSGPVMRLRGVGIEETEEDAAESPMDESLLRTNLGEVAFFMPQLRTNAEGEVTIAFTLPDGLTSWHLTGFAHTKDLMTGSIDETIVAQKELMAELQLPRFLRDGDEASLTASIRNISDTLQAGQATWQILDAETEKVVASGRTTFSLKAHSDTTYHFPYHASSRHPMLTVRWMAQTADGSDGEQRPLPVLSAMQSVTETKAFSLSGAKDWQIDLRKLFQGDNAKATNRRLTVEYTARPIWLAVQSLPSLMMPTYKDVLSLATTYYAGSLAAHIARSVPGMEKAIEEWKAEGLMESKLSRNQELSDILLHETPWVVEAQREKERFARLATLFETEAQTDRRMTILASMRALQQPDGSFAWYSGMRGSSYLTCSVAYLLTRLRIMTAGDEPDAATQTANQMFDRALAFLEKDVAREVAEARKMKHPAVSMLGMQYLYLALRTLHNPKGEAANDMKFMLDILKKDAGEMQGEQRALAAIDLYLSGEKKLAQSLMERFHTLLSHPDGTYLAYPGGSFTSIDRKIQRHVQVMEALATVEPEDTLTLQGMQEWLLQQKRTQEWEQPIQTADAVYALINGQDTSLYFSGGAQGSAPRDRLRIQDGRKSIELESPATSMGYLRERLDEVKNPRSLTVEKHSPALSWGAVYAQYEIPAALVEAQSEGLRIERSLSLSSGPSSMGQGEGKVGDRIHVRYVVTADRDYEYVRLNAPRPASAEPDAQISGYRWQGGIGYYRALHDSGSEYFFDRLPRGTYVIEEDWLLTHSGLFQLAPASLGCLYAPEFQAHTAGDQMHVK